LQRLHQLLETAKALDQLLLVLAQVLLRHPPQPFLGQVARIHAAFAADCLDTAKIVREHLVEPVDMPLVLHQRSSCQVVETLDIVTRQPAIQAFDQREVFTQRDRHLGGFEF
jgi:hypothetical protein